MAVEPPAAKVKCGDEAHGKPFVKYVVSGEIVAVTPLGLHDQKYKMPSLEKEVENRRR
jgi:hypothetical protein